MRNRSGTERDSKGSSTAPADVHDGTTEDADMRVWAYRLMSVFSDEDIDLIAARSRALGDPTRVRILAVLSRREQTVGQIADAAGTLQSTASKHLQVLFHAGVVQRRRDASTVIY